MEYFEKWHSKFWDDAEVRVKEIVSKIENILTTKAGLSLNSFSVDMSASDRLSEDVRAEVIQKAQAAVVEAVQLRELDEVINALDTNVFSDEQDPYFIVIDGLDENWAEASIQVKLISSLFECTGSLRNLKHPAFNMTHIQQP